MAEQNETARIKTVVRTARILETLEDLEGADLTELAENLEIAKSSTYNHLQTLEQEGYVKKHENKYHLDLGLLNLGGFARHNNKLYLLAKETTDELARETGELAALTTEHDGQSIYLYKAEGENATSYDSRLGVQLPIHCTAAGKAMLAHLSEEHRVQILNQRSLNRYTENTITDRSALKDELERIAKQGFSLDDEERIIGMRGVGAPVVDNSNDTVLGAIAVGGPTSRLSGSRFRNKLPDIVLRYAKEAGISATYS